MKAVQMAIHEERLAHSTRGTGPAVDKQQLQPGKKLTFTSALFGRTTPDGAGLLTWSGSHPTDRR